MTKNTQQETFEYIKKFFEENSRCPRLKELTLQFDVTNNAMLERLRRLEEEGFITMPDGVLSMRILKKSNDIFLSYSRQDSDVAKKIYDAFEDEGFRVWKDNMKLEQGDDFINELFGNIKNSKTFIVLLSDSSVESSFVSQEVSVAHKSFLDFGYPNILPVKVGDFDSKKVFPSISNIQREDFTGISDDKIFRKKMMEIADRIHRLAYSMPIKEKKSSSTLGTKDFVSKVEEDIKRLVETKLPPEKLSYPYRQVTIFPIGTRTSASNEDLKKINREIAVQINGWGGDRFPPYYYMHGEEADNMLGWIRSGNVRPWPGRSWGLEYWGMDKNYNFFTRSVLREAYDEVHGIKEKFSMDWLIFDVCRALMYAQNLVKKVGLEQVKINIKYSGLRERELVLLSRSRWGFDQSYKCHENEISGDIILTADSNIKEFAFNLCYEILTLFNWNQPNKQTLELDIAKFIDEKRFTD